MLAAFQSFNVQPGPQLFEDQRTLVWTLIASLPGVYSLSGSGYEVLMALLIGVVGCFMRKLDFQIAPVGSSRGSAAPNPPATA